MKITIIISSLSWLLLFNIYTASSGETLISLDLLTLLFPALLDLPPLDENCSPSVKMHSWAQQSSLPQLYGWNGRIPWPDTSWDLPLGKARAAHFLHATLYATSAFSPPHNLKPNLNPSKQPQAGLVNHPGWLLHILQMGKHLQPGLLWTSTFPPGKTPWQIFDYPEWWGTHFLTE